MPEPKSQPKENDMETRRIMFVESLEDEIIAAIEDHGPFHSAHEGYGVLLEEVRELEAEVFLKREKRCGQRMYEECVQIAAMAAKMAITIAEEIPSRDDELLAVQIAANLREEEANRGT